MPVFECVRTQTACDKHDHRVERAIAWQNQLTPDPIDACPRNFDCSFMNIGRLSMSIRYGCNSEQYATEDPRASNRHVLLFFEEKPLLPNFRGRGRPVR